MASVVMTAMVTIMVKRSCDRMPIDRPMRGDDDLGRAARIHAAADGDGFLPRHAGDLAADEGAAELADAGDERRGRASAARASGRRAR